MKKVFFIGFTAGNKDCSVNREYSGRISTDRIADTFMKAISEYGIPDNFPYSLLAGFKPGLPKRIGNYSARVKILPEKGVCAGCTPCAYTFFRPSRPPGA